MKAAWLVQHLAVRAEANPNVSVAVGRNGSLNAFLSIFISEERNASKWRHGTDAARSGQEYQGEKKWLNGPRRSTSHAGSIGRNVEPFTRFGIDLTKQI